MTAEELPYIEAALYVLTTSGPELSTRDLGDRVLASGRLRSRSRTPRASLTAALYRELGKPNPRIERHFEKGLHRAKAGSVRWRLPIVPR